MKKICFFIGGMGLGGAERVISILANSFADRGYDVSIVMLLNSNNVFYIDPRVKLVNINGRRKKRLLNLAFWIKKIKLFLRKEKPDIIVSFVCRINLIVIIAKLLSRIKTRLVISERNDPRFDGRGVLSKVLSKILYPKADLIICQTSMQMSFLSKRAKAKSIVISNPITLEVPIIDFSDKKRFIVNAARYDKSKNQLLLIKAFQRIVINKETDGFTLHFYGSGPFKETLEKFIARNNLSKYIILHESVSNMQAIISEASIFCLSSNYEGMSNSLLEAALLGTPSISTDVNGARDIIFDGLNGFIVPVGNVDEMYNKLVTLIQSEGTRKKFYDYCISKEYRDHFFESLDAYIYNIEGV